MKTDVESKVSPRFAAAIAIGRVIFVFGILALLSWVGCLR
jgi:hypothetical protein